MYYSRRMKALKELLSLERSTSKATPFKEWETPPEVHLETEEAKTIFEKNEANPS